MKKLLTVLLCLGLAGCATEHAVVTPTNKDFEVNGSKTKVFDAALHTAQELNLDVKVIEKDSGIIRFERANLTPAQMDQYCEYPILWANSQKPQFTFQQEIVPGNASITILVTEHGASSSVNVRTNISCAYNLGDCNSKGVLEDEFLTKLQSHLK